MVHQLFVSGEDPYAGADLPSSRNATVVLIALQGILILVLLPCFRPTKVLARRRAGPWRLPVRS